MSRTKCSIDIQNNLFYFLEMSINGPISEIALYSWAFLTAKLPEEPSAKRAEINRLAVILKVSSRFLDYVIRKERNLGSDSQVLLARHYGLSHFDMLAAGKELLQGGGHKANQFLTLPHECFTPNVMLAGQMDNIPELKIEDYYAAPLIDGQIAAGPGRALSETELRSLVWIYAPELRGRMHHRLIAVQIDDKTGDSMLPTLNPGDIVLVDCDEPGGDEHAFKRKGIYAIRSSRYDECSIKRLYNTEKGIIIISSDNKDYAPEIAWTGNLKELIIGRVVWGWRNLLDV